MPVCCKCTLQTNVQPATVAPHGRFMLWPKGRVSEMASVAVDGHLINVTTWFLSSCKTWALCWNNRMRGGRQWWTVGGQWPSCKPVQSARNVHCAKWQKTWTHFQLKWVEDDVKKCNDIFLCCIEPTEFGNEARCLYRGTPPHTHTHYMCILSFFTLYLFVIIQWMCLQVINAVALSFCVQSCLAENLLKTELACVHFCWSIWCTVSFNNSLIAWVHSYFCEHASFMNLMSWYANDSVSLPESTDPLPHFI